MKVRAGPGGERRQTMRSHERTRALRRAPKLAWDVLAKGRYDFVYDQMPMCASGMSRTKRVNLLKAGANLIYRRLRPWSMPLHMQFELTNYCDLRCPVCPTGSRAMKRQPQAMDVDMFERLMDDAGPYLLTMSLWAWGEPLLHPRLEEILRIARKHDVVTLLSTNGQHLNKPRNLEALANEPPDYLILALDGLTDETNTMYRVGASVGPALDGIRQLARIKKQRGLKRPVLNMRYIVMKHNQHEMARLNDFARDHGFELLTIRNMYTIESTASSDTTDRMKPDEEIWARCGHGFGGDAPRGSYVCQEPFWFPSVFADGTAVLCEQDYNAGLSLGRVSESVSFADLWYGKRARGLRRKIRDQMESLDFCRKCPYLDRPITDFNVEARFLDTDEDPESLKTASAGNAGF